MKEGEKHEAEFFGGPIARSNHIRRYSAKKWKREDETNEARDLPDVAITITIKGDNCEIRLG